mgnify:CR=1 FL=1
MTEVSEAFWAAMTAENLVHLRPPREVVRSVTIWADDDDSGTGERKARQAAACPTWAAWAA